MSPELPMNKKKKLRQFDTGEPQYNWDKDDDVSVDLDTEYMQMDLDSHLKEARKKRHTAIRRKAVFVESWKRHRKFKGLEIQVIEKSEESIERIREMMKRHQMFKYLDEATKESLQDAMVEQFFE